MVNIKQKEIIYRRGIIAHTESQGFEQTPEPKCYTLVCVTDVIQLLQHRLTGKTCLYLHFHKTPKTPFVDTID